MQVRRMGRRDEVRGGIDMMSEGQRKGEKSS